jgi:hypothetical protein
VLAVPELLVLHCLREALKYSVPLPAPRNPSQGAIAIITKELDETVSPRSSMQNIG